MDLSFGVVELALLRIRVSVLGVVLYMAPLCLPPASTCWEAELSLLSLQGSCCQWTFFGGFQTCCPSLFWVSTCTSLSEKTALEGCYWSLEETSIAAPLNKWGGEAKQQRGCSDDLGETWLNLRIFEKKLSTNPNWRHGETKPGNCLVLQGLLCLPKSSSSMQLLEFWPFPRNSLLQLRCQLSEILSELPPVN